MKPNLEVIQHALNILGTLQLNAYLWPQDAKVPDGSIFDFIVVGAGSAGCVVADRLSENENINVLLIEAGGDPPIETMFPALQNIMKKTKYDWNNRSIEDGFSQQFSESKAFELTRGKMLGGSSGINLMIYTRGYQNDYDNWARIVNDSTWNWDGVLPYFMMSEHQRDSNILKSPHSNWYGTRGNIKLKRYYRDEAKFYLKTFNELGHDIVLDINGNGTLGFAEPMFTVGDGVSQNTAVGFISPNRFRPNLFVLKNTMVTEILINSKKRAYGVKVLSNDNKIYKIRARREIIVSAGPINTAQLLLLSGIGPKRHLRDMKINVIKNLPVGLNFQNTVGTFLVYKTRYMNGISKPNIPHEIENPSVIGCVAVNKKQKFADYEIYGTIFKAAEKFYEYCKYFLDINTKACDYLYENTKGREIFSVINFLLNPKSRGRVLLRSKNPRDSPKVITGCYSNKEDLKNHVTYVKHFLPVVNSTMFKNVKAELVDPTSEKCGKFPKDSDEHLLCYVRHMMIEAHHYCGTCAMGSVVNSRLRVYGIAGLRVADSSVMPEIIRGHVNAPSIMIGQKAAEFIKEDYFL